MYKLSIPKSIFIFDFDNCVALYPAIYVCGEMLLVYLLHTGTASRNGCGSNFPKDRLLTQAPSATLLRCMNIFRLFLIIEFSFVLSFRQ